MTTHLSGRVDASSVPPATTTGRGVARNLRNVTNHFQLYGRQTVNNVHFALAVIAYGDADGISETLESVARQDLDAGISLSVIVARHHESITEAGIREALAGSAGNVTIVDIPPHDDVNVMRCAALPAIAAAMPDDADWAWTLETGHRLYQHDSLQLLAKTIRQNAYANVNVVHVCDAGQSFNSGHIQHKTVDELCQAFGYFEILGKVSSLIIRPAHYKFAFNTHLADTAAAANDGEIWVSHHTHSQFLFLALSQTTAVLADLKLVDLDSGAEWATPRKSHEWFKIAREIVELGAAAGKSTKWNPHFFRYGTVSLWSELVRQQSLCAKGFTPNINSDSVEMLHFIDQWQVLLRLADHVAHQEVNEVICDVVTNGIRLTLDFLQSEDGDTSRMESFFEEQTRDIKTYPTTLFRADYLTQLMQKSA